MGDPQHDPSQDAVQPEFRDDAGDGDLGAEETGPEGLGAGSGTGSAHEYPGRAPAEVDETGDRHDSGDAADGPERREPERD